ncbi:MAG: sugar phosphate nucleotidyltransferase, partial [Candidatus Methanoperedens sp.]|nr:sugar phosphate nucleotidyltransferase [Candidatus Methanoperedens sp.]
MNGDIIVNPAYIRKLTECSSDMVLTARHVDNPSEYGVFEVQGARVLRIIEKSPDPPTNLANAGIYVFPSSIFDAISKTPLSVRKEYEITDSLQTLIDKGTDVGFLTLSDKWMDIGRPWELLDAN